MGLFDRMKQGMSGGAGGASGDDWTAQAQAAQALAAEEMRKAGYLGSEGGIPTAADINGGLGAQMAADQQVLQSYGEELKRVYAIGDHGTGTIVSSVDTGERTAGQAWFQIDTEVTLPGKDAYTASKREMVPESTMAQYAVGTAHEVRVDPADPQRYVFAS